MLTLNDGRSELWQWDTGRTLAVDADCSQVHFSNKVFGRSIDVDVVDGVAIIPDVLLQTDKDLNVWAFVGTAENGYTKISKIFKVNKRNKPSDYVFTPPDQTTLQEIEEKIKRLESIEFPVTSVNNKTGNVELNADDVGAISQEGLQSATDVALSVAKESGLFDGADGYTPVKGVDYGTPEEIAGIAKQAVDSLRPEVNQIKSDLADKLPKSPANWEQWTAEEQAAARERMGIPGDYELIESFTMTEAGIFDRNTEPDGTPYNFRKLLVFRYYPSTVDVSEATGWTQLYFFNSKGKVLRSECGIPSKTESANISLFENNLNKSDVKYSRTYGISNGFAYLCSRPIKGHGWDIGFGNCVRVVVPSSDKEQKGTRIEIYGVRG